MAAIPVEPADFKKMVKQLRFIATEMEWVSNQLALEHLPPIQLQIETRQKQIEEIFRYAKLLRGRLDAHRDDAEAGRLAESDRDEDRDTRKNKSPKS